MRERGTTLLEATVVAAIVVLAAVAFFALSQGARVFAMRSATGQFDATLAYAQALAANNENGATLVFDKRFASDGSTLAGFTLTIYSGRPTASGALKKAPMSPVQSSADVSEAQLGGVPFTIFLNGAGHASGMPGAVGTAILIASDPGCPAGESSVVLTFSDSHSSQRRSIRCNGAVAGAPVSIETVAPAEPP